MSENLIPDKERIYDNSMETLDESGPAQMSTTSVREKRKLTPSTRAIEAASPERIKLIPNATKTPAKRQKANKISDTRHLIVSQKAEGSTAIEEDDEDDDADLHTTIPHESSSETVMYGTAEDFENMSTEQLAIFERLLETAKAHHDAAPIKADAEKASGGPVHDPRLTSSLPQAAVCPSYPLSETILYELHAVSHGSRRCIIGG